MLTGPVVTEAWAALSSSYLQILVRCAAPHFNRLLHYRSTTYPTCSQDYILLEPPWISSHWGKSAVSCFAPFTCNILQDILNSRALFVSLMSSLPHATCNKFLINLISFYSYFTLFYYPFRCIFTVFCSLFCVSYIISLQLYLPLIWTLVTFL